MYVGQATNPFARGITKYVRLLLVITCTVFLVQLVVDLHTDGFFSLIFGLSREGLTHGLIWQPVTYMFLHSRGLMHILFNMLGLYFFGCEMEDVLGSRRFLKLYLGCGVLAGLGWTLISSLTGGLEYCIGASGAVYGVLGTFAAMFPDRMVTLLLFFVLPVTMSARTLAIGLGIVSFLMLFSSDGNIAHAAHLAGGIAGYMYGYRIAKQPGLLDSDLYGSDRRSSLLSNIRSFFARKRMRIAKNDQPAPSRQEVDRILEKITEQGLDSLSKQERETLEKASKHGRP